jgi:nucleotide-binding universal stress UspA family protein
VRVVKVFEKLLFPTDFSPFNERLARCLPELKRLGPEEIVLLNVVELGPQIGFASDAFEKMLAWKNDAEPRLAALKAQLDRSGLRCRSRLELGRPALEIVRVADEERVALIAMGSHGHGFLKGMLLGSVTHDVVRHAMVPVLVLKLELVKDLATTDCEFVCQHIFRRVLLPTDFSEPATEALYLVKQMGSTGLKEIVVLHVREDGHQASGDMQDEVESKLARIRQELEFFGFSVNVIVAEGGPAELIDQVAREEDVSLIVIGARGRNAAADVLLGSISDEVVCRHVCPVLVARTGSVQ